MNIELVGTFVNPNPVARPYKKPMKPGDAGVARGVLYCMVILYREAGMLTPEWLSLLQVVQMDSLLKVARRSGLMRFSGLSEHLRIVAKYAP